MEQTLTTIATYRFAQQADLARVLLTEVGIQAFVADGNTVTMDWFLGNAIGYVKLQVPSSQAPMALEFFRAHPELLDAAHPEPHDTDRETCLACGAPLPGDAESCQQCGWSYGRETTETEPEQRDASEGSSRPD